MHPVLLRSLALELQHLYRNGYDERIPGTRFLNVLSWGYFPEDMSDCENRVVWTNVVLLSLQYGVTTTDYEKRLGISAMELQQWMNGVSMPSRVQKRKNLYQAITELVSIKQSTG